MINRRNLTISENNTIDLLPDMQNVMVNEWAWYPYDNTVGVVGLKSVSDSWPNFEGIDESYC